MGRALPAAAQLPAKSGADNEPVRITADAMDVKTAQNLIVFSGNVVVVRGNLTVHADRARITTAKDQNRKIDEMEAEGNIRIDQVVPEEKIERHATGRKAVYREADGRLVLTGDPRAWEKENVITGETMTFNTLDNQFLVDGKVKIIFYPDERLEKANEPSRK
jgi:lipopolysaccharide export system protein LptA